MGWRWLWFAILMSSSPALWAGTEVERAEVLRWGDTVQHVQPGFREANGEQAAAGEALQALGPPASDADKWFISLLTMQGCAPCEKLKREWSRDPWLLALANPQDPQQSWSHFNVYSREDESQAFRFAALEIQGYPTILVQPPRNGKYGEPRTVVYQATYRGNPKELAEEITRAIRLYVERQSQPRRLQAANTERPIGVDPPWRPAPKDDPLGPLVLPDVGPQRPLIPPVLDGSRLGWEIPWSSLLSIVIVLMLLPFSLSAGLWLLLRVWHLGNAARAIPVEHPRRVRKQPRDRSETPVTTTDSR